MTDVSKNIQAALLQSQTDKIRKQQLNTAKEGNKIAKEGNKIAKEQVKATKSNRPTVVGVL